jgi:hypothetical protein
VAIACVLGERRVTLDGELVCLRSDGRPDFARLRRRLTGGRTAEPVVLQIFDVLHLDGCSTRQLPYRERRALLDELALEGPAWRTPGAWWSSRARISSRASGSCALKESLPSGSARRTCPAAGAGSWVKHKLRREERLAVTGLRRSRQGHAEAICVARRRPEGTFTGAGSIELGLRHELVERLEVRLAEPPARRRGYVAWYPAEVSVVASLPGPPEPAGARRSPPRRAGRLCRLDVGGARISSNISAIASATRAGRRDEPRTSLPAETCAARRTPGFPSDQRPGLNRRAITDP